MSNRYLLCNKIRTPDGTVLQSYSVHDYKTYRDKNDKVYMVDGGLDYLRRNVHEDAPYEELSIYSDAPHEVVRENFTWGTYGKNGDQPMKRVLLCDMSDDHIKAILNYSKPPAPFIEQVFIQELSYREQHDLHIHD